MVPAAAPSSPLLEARHLVRRFGALVAVNDVSFTVPSGEVLGIAGPNGSGKSTLFNVITGIPFGPSSGEVLLDGRPMTGQGAERIARSGLLRTFQKDAEFGTLTAFENAYASACFNAGRKGEEGRDAAARALKDAGLPEARWSLPSHALTVFERKQLMIASALAGAPRLLLLDEPAAGLTQPEVAGLDALIRTVRDRGVTILLIEHVLSLLLAVSDRLMVLDQGRIIAEGLPSEVVRNPAVVTAYLGSRGAAA
ncbi:ABC transporter ATP-binding protein [Rubellimicrobium arenae]|uniref:ABC transporter ATP-binding protein n=1 Tax=Rubellimicrobium arenae TaxID=2817372 RepID=UPI001B302C9B|nr:ABC transporter ATP-binding protein [Rubellimicrobium arenae]